MPRLVYEIRGRRFTSNYLKKVRKATTHFEGDIVTHDRAARSNAPSPPFLHHAMRVYNGCGEKVDESSGDDEWESRLSARCDQHQVYPVRNAPFRLRKST
jgi:hypothetical protein